MGDRDSVIEEFVGENSGPSEQSIADAAVRPDAAATAVLIDDHQVVLEGLTRTLQREGMNVVATFVDGDSAVTFLRNRPVDLVVVDLRLQNRSGLAVVDAVHRMHPDTRIAVLTSFEDRAAASAAVHAGATGFLLKDTPIDELARRLRGVATGTLVIDARVAGAVLRPEQRLLSGHELSILELVAEGMTNREIGARLHLSHYTVKDYLTRIMRKLGTRSRAETVARAVQQGLLAGRN
ncbi:MAG: response regulator transcription factor [Sporichthyaceae bacterium]